MVQGSERRTTSRQDGIRLQEGAGWSSLPGGRVMVCPHRSSERIKYACSIGEVRVKGESAIQCGSLTPVLSSRLSAAKSYF